MLHLIRTLHLASLAEGLTAPNPLVGAVLVCDRKIIGEGFHRQYGGPHAEVNAIRSAIQNGNEALLSRSTLYVNLEPCSHHGKTPPCTELIIQSKIPKVVIGTEDPFPDVNGNGIQQLRAAGIEVVQDVYVKECLWLNRRFFTFHYEKRPYVILKYAQTADHFIAPSSPDVSNKISSSLTDLLVHRWRSQEAAIMVGTRTASVDNPFLNARLWFGKNPVRMVIDKELKLSPKLHLFDQSQRTIVLNEVKSEINGLNEFEKINFNLPFGEQLFNLLYKKQLQSIIIEGGSVLLNYFIKHNLWDEARIITSGKRFGSGVPAPVIKGKEFYRMKESGDEILYLKSI